MSLILGIETSTKMCSVAINNDSKLLAFREQGGDYSHAELLAVFIKEVCDDAKISLQDIDYVAVGRGPGSYTGLRIGTSAAKGICYAIEKPLLSIDTLKIMTFKVIETGFYKDYLFCPMIDARRKEVYTSVYNSKLEEIIPISAKIIDENSFSELLKSEKILFFGDGAEKCKSVLKKHTNAIFIDNIEPSSIQLNLLANKMLNNNPLFEDVAYYEPFYLKDFITTSGNK
ncbi:MAG: tRNA (adenosine(37)-N6)-threonylcarbamoyltransferase complex dimerization subunit type 1 TsaB [Flavobacteriales bacterium]|nr:tRNA (adenosine(37)-N6)-threonylcarbamoyltransferase complex dimerization subunit type 1 TsaB [Flavobacteriales bacterium]